MGVTMVTVSLLFLLLSAFSPPVHTAFYFIPDKMTWTAAQRACKENYTDLATVYSDGDNAELVTVMNKNNIRDGWIGLHRYENKEKSWKWSNGDAVTFMQQIRNCEKGISSPFCAAMNDASGDWDSIQCNQTRHFMCYKQGDPKYHLILEKKTWYEAQSYCRRNYTDLVSIRDEQQNKKVKEEGSNSTTPFWIGLWCDGWQWSDGGNSTYRNREIDHPQNKKTCAKLSTSNRKWHAVDCNDKLPALCYRSFIHVSEEPLNWEEALDYCYEDNRAGLLKIESATEQKDVESELKRRGISEPVWVGLRQSQLFGFWLWPNGNAVHQYSNWAKGNQPEHQLSQHCGAVEPRNEYRWRDKNCLSRYRALCHIKCPA